MTSVLRYSKTMNEKLKQINQNVLIQLRLNRENLYDVKLKIDFDTYIEHLQPFTTYQTSILQSMKYHFEHLSTYIFDIDQEIIEDMVITFEKVIEEIKTMDDVEEKLLLEYEWVQAQLKKASKRNSLLLGGLYGRRKIFKLCSYRYRIRS